MRQILLLAACLVSVATFAAEPRAARSVHLGYPAPAATMFYNEMTIDQSTTGSYFMANGWNTGYFGLQELGNGKKVVIFSVWDPTKGDNPNNVKLEDRVECLFQADDVRIKRFGGEGTGGQCMADFEWQSGQTYRFLVAAKVEGEKTAYSGFISSAEKPEWKQLVTFRVRTGGKPLSGLYSFVEDFRRDGKSVQQVRQGHYGNAWVKDVEGKWTPLSKARFTASSSEWESKENINAGLDDAGYFLATGGETKRQNELNKSLPERKLPDELRPPVVPEEWK
jgi:hypothetical protein